MPLLHDICKALIPFAALASTVASELLFNSRCRRPIYCDSDRPGHPESIKTMRGDQCAGLPLGEVNWSQTCGLIETRRSATCHAPIRAAWCSKVLPSLSLKASTTLGPTSTKRSKTVRGSGPNNALRASTCRVWRVNSSSDLANTACLCKRCSSRSCRTLDITSESWFLREWSSGCFSPSKTDRPQSLAAAPCFFELAAGSSGA